MTGEFPDNPWEPELPDNPWVASFVKDAEPPAPVPGRVNAVDFRVAMQRNRRNTWFLMLGMLALAGGFGYGLGWLGDMAVGNTSATPSPLGIKLAIALLAGMTVWAVMTLARADRMVLKMTDAQETDARSLPQLHNIVEEIAIAAGLPKPRIVLVPSETPNAFATGLRTENAVIGVTAGLLQRLNRRELQGVIAHEMGHILNGDMRYATLLAIMTGALVFVAQMILGLRHFIGYASFRPRDDERRQSHPLMLVFAIIAAIIAAVLVPLIAKLIQMGVSRQREYLADATAVQLTRDPQSMIAALEKIAALQTPSINLPQRLEPLYIMPPTKMLHNGNNTWFSTHPSLQNRIARLKSLE